MLLDTSGLLCYLDQREEQHQDALTYFTAAPQRVTHNYVLTELVALCLARGVPHALALDFTFYLTQTAFVEVVWVDKSLHDAAMALLQARLDKEWSLCDAVSFVLMGQRGLTEALTTDHHFEQAGLRRLLRGR